MGVEWSGDGYHVRQQFTDILAIILLVVMAIVGALAIRNLAGEDNCVMPETTTTSIAPAGRVYEMRCP